MTVNKFLNKWYNKEFEDWGGETSPEYKIIFRQIIKVL